MGSDSVYLVWYREKGEERKEESHEKSEAEIRINATTSQGTPRATSHSTKQEHSSKKPLREHDTANTFILDFWVSKIMREYIFVVLSCTWNFSKAWATDKNPQAFSSWAEAVAQWFRFCT